MYKFFVYGLTIVKFWYGFVEVKPCYGMSRKVSSSLALNINISTTLVENFMLSFHSHISLFHIIILCETHLIQRFSHHYLQII
jgi:hypothetical protein